MIENEYKAVLMDGLAVVGRAVDIMTDEQLGQWRGVRAWQEQAGALVESGQAYTETGVDECEDIRASYNVMAAMLTSDWLKQSVLVALEVMGKAHANALHQALLYPPGGFRASYGEKQQNKADALAEAAQNLINLLPDKAKARALKIYQDACGKYS